MTCRCRYRYVFADGSKVTGERIGSPRIIEAAGYLAGAFSVTVLVVA